MPEKIRTAVAVVCFAAAVFFLLPLGAGLHHIGMFYPAGLLLALAYFLWKPQKVRAWLTGRHRFFFRLLAACLAAGVLLMAALFALMVRQAENRPAGEEPVTVVVPGCEVIGHQPGRMLSDRIDAAYAYLSAHPEAVCVACGGMADAEMMTEAQCIRQELLARGIAAERIYTEEQSENTAQNIAYAAAIIRREGLPAQIAAASDNFHQLRISIYARQNGLTAQSLGCRSYWFLSAGYWAREMVAVVAAWTIGR